MQDLGWYSVVPGVRRGIALALLPIYTFYLMPAEYGIIALVTLVVALTTQLASWGVSYAILRNYLDYSGDGAKEFLFTALVVVVFSTSLVYGLVYLFADVTVPKLIAAWEPRYRHYLSIGLITQMLLDIANVPTTWLVVERRSRYHAGLHLTVLLVAVPVELYLLTQARMGVLAIFYGHLVGAVLTLILGLGILIPNLKARLRWDVARHIGEYGWQVVPMNVMGYGLKYVDRWVVQAFLPLGQLGLYEFGAKAQQAMAMYADSAKKAWRPVYLRQLNEGASRAELLDFGNVMFALSLLVAVSLMLYTKEILALLTAPAYHSAYIVASLLIAQTFFQRIAPFIGVYSLVYEKKMYFSVLSVVMTGTLAVFLSLQFVQVLAMEGVALAMMLAFAAHFLLNTYWAHRYTDVGVAIDWKRWVVLLLAAGVVSVPVFVDFGLSPAGLVVLKTLGLGIFTLVVGMGERKRLSRLRERADVAGKLRWLLGLSSS